MVHEYLFTKVGGVNVCVYLGGGDGFVTEHSLDGTQIGTSFEQGGSKGVAECVGGNFFLYTCFLHEVFDHEEHHDSGEGFAATFADEDIVLVFGRDVDVAAFGKIELEFVDCLGRDGDEALLAAFSFHLDKFVIEEEVAEF